MQDTEGADQEQMAHVENLDSDEDVTNENSESDEDVNTDNLKSNEAVDTESKSNDTEGPKTSEKQTTISENQTTISENQTTTKMVLRSRQKTGTRTINDQEIETAKPAEKPTRRLHVNTLIEVDKRLSDNACEINNEINKKFTEVDKRLKDNVREINKEIKGLNDNAREVSKEISRKFTSTNVNIQESENRILEKLDKQITLMNFRNDELSSSMRELFSYTQTRVEELAENISHTKNHTNFDSPNRRPNEDNYQARYDHQRVPGDNRTTHEEHGNQPNFARRSTYNNETTSHTNTLSPGQRGNREHFGDNRTMHEEYQRYTNFAGRPNYNNGTTSHTNTFSPSRRGNRNNWEDQQDTRRAPGNKTQYFEFTGPTDIAVKKELVKHNLTVFSNGDKGETRVTLIDKKSFYRIDNFPKIPSGEGGLGVLEWYTYMWNIQKFLEINNLHQVIALEFNVSEEDPSQLLLIKAIHTRFVEWLSRALQEREPELAAQSSTVMDTSDAAGYKYLQFVKTEKRNSFRNHFASFNEYINTLKQSKDESIEAWSNRLVILGKAVKCLRKDLEDFTNSTEAKIHQTILLTIEELTPQKLTGLFIKGLHDVRILKIYKNYSTLNGDIEGTQDLQSLTRTLTSIRDNLELYKRKDGFGSRRNRRMPDTRTYSTEEVDNGWSDEEPADLVEEQDTDETSVMNISTEERALRRRNLHRFKGERQDHNKQRSTSRYQTRQRLHSPSTNNSYQPTTNNPYQQGPTHYPHPYSYPQLFGAYGPPHWNPYWEQLTPQMHHPRTTYTQHPRAPQQLDQNPQTLANKPGQPNTLKENAIERSGTPYSNANHCETNPYTDVNFLQPEEINALTNKDFANGNCNKCKEPGHTFRTCPKVRCHECKQLGHIRSDCPNAGKD